jgi:MBG domain-containing protein/Big-like domain-containing protein/PKD domain-containing protein
MKLILTLLLILTLSVGSIVGLFATPVAARVYSVQPTNEDGGPPTDQFTTADPIFAIFMTDVEGGEICVVPEGHPDDKSYCKIIANYFGTGWWLIARGLPAGRYQLLAHDPGYSFLSAPFIVSECVEPDCAERRRLSDETVAEWKRAATEMHKRLEKVDLYLDIYNYGNGFKAARGTIKEKITDPRRSDDLEVTNSFEVEILSAVGGVLAVGFTFIPFDVPTSLDGAFITLAKEVTAGTKRMYEDIMNDPPDPDYMIVAPPTFMKFPITGDAERDHLIKTLDRQRAFGRAQLKAYERYLGAVAAGDEIYARLQAQAIADYGNSFISEMKDSAASLRSWGAGLDPNTPVISQSQLDDVASVYERVRASGFAQDELNQLAAAGLTQEQIEQVQSVFNDDIRQAPVGVSLPSILNQAASALEANVPAINTFSKEAAWVTAGRAPKAVSLAPASASLSVGATHTVTTHVTDARNATVAGIKVTLSVTGANPATLMATTDASGTATFSYVGANPGEDTLSTTAGTATSNNATVNWTVGPPNAVPVVFGHNDLVDEGDINGSEFHFTDADAQDTHTATIDWGDGSPPDTYPKSDGEPGYVEEKNGSGYVRGYHTYADSGVYNLTGTVTDNRGATGTAVKTANVRNIAPTLSNVALEEVNGGIIIKANFTDRGVKDTHTATVNWGDGSNGPVMVTEANGSGAISGNHTYAGPGNYTITLVVADDDGGTASRNIGFTLGNGGLDNSPPSLQLSNYITSEGGGSFGAEFTDPDSLDVHTATINWGDGSPVEALFVNYGNGSGFLNGNHQYVDNGTFTITVTVADNHGGFDTKVSTMNVQNSAPRVFAVGFTSNNRLYTVGETITASSGFEDFGVRDTHTAVWDWGDGTSTPATFTEKNGSSLFMSESHTYNSQGVYIIRLLVTDNDGATGVGSAFETIGLYASITAGSIKPVVTETGKISSSISGLGISEGNGVLRVEKPAGATVRRAYLGAVTTGFRSYLLRPGDVKIDNVDAAWDIATPSGIHSYNYWSDVTHIIKAKVDSAPAGRIDFSLQEAVTDSIEGEVLVVIFDDPNQLKDNTIVLLFGAQQTAGDTFALRFAQPLNQSDPNFALMMSLGISFGYQRTVSNQFSTIDVNGQRMTASAGGEDDGASVNGALLTVGGIDDNPANPPDSQAAPTNGPRSDDELYDLKPFVNAGDTELTVVTSNPSNDDNIFFAAFFLQDTAAVVGEGVVLTPVSASHEVGAEHTLTATAQDARGGLIRGRDVTFEILSGPHAGLTQTVATDAQGLAQFSYIGTQAGTDTIVARFVNSESKTQTSNTVTATWEAEAIAPTLLVVSPASGTYGGTTELSAHLTVGGTPLIGSDVSFSLNGMTLGVARTDANGVATISNVSLAGINAGTHQNAITASFAGDTGRTASNGTADLTVSKAKLTVTAANASRKYGDPNPMFSGTITGIKNSDEIIASYSTAATPTSNAGAYDIVPALTDSAGKLSNYDVTQIKGTLTVSKAALSVLADDKSKVYGTVNPPLTVHYSGFVNGEDASVLAGSLSLSTTSTTGSPVGSYPITARGLTSSNYDLTFVNGKLMVTKAVLIITADNKSRIYNAVNPPLTFKPSGFVNGDTAATAFTGVPTLATAAQTNSSVGAYPITAATGTLSSVNYGFAFVPGILTVNQAPTTTVTDGKLFANNSAGILTATLLDTNSLPIVNRSLTLTLGTGPGAQTCSAMTDAVGKASCRINTVMQPLGPGTISGRFAGDNNYLSSGSSASTLIFEYPAGGAGGSFIISDRNAVVGKQVTFWGAQWANSNPLNVGAAPSSFKGFANQTNSNPASCGGKWTTGPGNSSGPPNSIPTYMAVIVSSSITKSGSTIAGDVRQVVIVKTDPGYDSNPGHAGTGTVVAVWCH